MNEQTQKDPAISSSFRVVYVGSIAIGLPEERVLTIVEWREPTPLPSAPELVLGIIAAQGRMFTVLDTAKLLNIESSSRNFIVVLRGKEQLALTIDAANEAIQAGVDDLQPPPESAPALIKGMIPRRNKRIHLLALNELFDTAIQGYERRRRRF